MFRRDVQQIKDILLRNLRDQGLETPLMQKRLVDSWPQVAGELIASYTLNTYIVNQTFPPPTLCPAAQRPGRRPGHHRHPFLLVCKEN